MFKVDLITFEGKNLALFCHQLTLVRAHWMGRAVVEEQNGLLLLSMFSQPLFRLGNKTVKKLISKNIGRLNYFLDFSRQPTVPSC